MKNFQAILFLLLLGNLSACEAPFFQKWQDIPLLKWEQSQIIANEVGIENPGNYKITLGIRHILETPYAEIKVAMDLESPSGKKDSRNYVIKLRNEKNEVLGEALSELVDLLQTVEESYAFSEKGTYKIIIRHAMNLPTLGGIIEVGLVIDPAKP